MKLRSAVVAFVSIVFLTGCHHAVVSTGVYGDHVATGVSAHVDGDAGTILALSLIGAMVGGAIYEDTHAYQASGLSAIDVNIRPINAEISLDGVVMGTADDFDGFPEFLVVEPGSHRVRARCEGYKTYEVTVNLGPGQQVNLNKRMEAGSDAVEPTPQPVVAAQEPVVESEDYIRLVLTLDNPQASVYVDGSFVGTGRELNLLHGPLLLEPDARDLVVVTAESRKSYRIADLRTDAVDGVIRLHIE